MSVANAIAAQDLPDKPLDVSELYRAHADRVARWAQRLGGPRCDAEDVVQDVFLAARRGIASLRSAESALPWLYRITENVVRGRRRRDRLRRFFGLDDIDEPVSPAPPLDEEVAARQRCALLYQVLDEMREKQRNILVLFEMEGMSGEAIAQLTGMKLATVWVNLHRARAEFMRRMTELEREEAPR